MQVGCPPAGPGRLLAGPGDGDSKPPPVAAESDDAEAMDDTEAAAGGTFAAGVLVSETEEPRTGGSTADEDEIAAHEAVGRPAGSPEPAPLSSGAAARAGPPPKATCTLGTRRCTAEAEAPDAEIEVPEDGVR